MDKETVNRISYKIVDKFRCFGGGKGSQWNPVAEALKNRSPQFAAGVDVKDVVAFVMQELET